MSKRKTPESLRPPTYITTAQLQKKMDKARLKREAAYAMALKVMTDMEVWQEFQRACVPDDWDGMFTDEGEWNKERCREEMTDRLRFANLREAERETEDI